MDPPPPLPPSTTARKPTRVRPGDTLEPCPLQCPSKCTKIYNPLFAIMPIFLFRRLNMIWQPINLVFTTPGVHKLSRVTLSGTCRRTIAELGTGNSPLTLFSWPTHTFSSQLMDQMTGICESFLSWGFCNAARPRLVYSRVAKPPSLLYIRLSG